MRTTARTAGTRIAVACAAALYVAAVYLIVVLGVGALLGVQAPNVGLVLVATALVAVTLEPVRAALRKRFPVSDQDRLAAFTGTLAAVVATDDVAPGLARLVAGATGARRVEIWLSAIDPERHDAPPGDRELAARWPVEAAPIDVAGADVIVHPIRGAGGFDGVLIRDAATAVDPREQRLVDSVVDAATGALRTVALSIGIERSIDAAQARAAELRASRLRLVAAEDDARRGIERDIHDGAQQHLVALSVSLSLVASVSARDPGRAALLIDELIPAATDALTALDELTRGIFPPALVHDGPVPALRAAVHANAVPVQVTGRLRRLTPAIEAALYFCALEAVRNATKHAAATTISVHVANENGLATMSVRDDGVGFDPASAMLGAGLGNMNDRLVAVGGSLRVDSRPAAGTVLTASIPLVAR